MARGPDVGGVGALGREADGMVDLARAHLLVEKEPGQDGKPGRIGRGPTSGAERV